MRCFISFFIFCLIVSMQIGCSGGAAANGTNVAEINQNTDANSPVSVPAFTDASDALAAGSKFLDDGETEKAIDALNQAVKLNPDLAEGHFKRGIAYALIEARGDTLPAETPTPNPKGKRPKEVETNSEKSFEKAVAAYKKMLRANDDDDVAHFNLGLAYNKLNEDENAAKSLKQAVKLKPEDTEYQTELGSILIKLARYNDAVPALKKALELDAFNAKAEQLLENAQAGRKRINFTTANKDDKKPLKSDDLSKGGELPDLKTKPKTRNPKETKPATPAVKVPDKLR